jgi:hypothetical protein
MRSPWRGLEQLYFLGHHERPEFRGKALNEVLVCKDRHPMSTAIGVVLELPKMDKLIDCAGVSLEIADQVFVVPSLLERWIPKFLVQLNRLGHCSDAKRVGSHLV